MKIRFAQLYAAHAAFDRYAAIIIAKASHKASFAERKNRSDFFIIAKTRVQSGGGSLPRESAVITLTKEKSVSKYTNLNYFKEINFFVDEHNKFCNEFVEYVFSAWARALPQTLSMAYAPPSQRGRNLPIT